LRTLGIFILFLKLLITTIKKLKSYYTDKIFPNAIYNFGNSDMNFEYVKISFAKQFLTRLRVDKTEISQVGVASS